jgi:hypothetical protein
MGLKQIAVAAGVGYVLGAKAGEQRYAQIKELWGRLGDLLSASPRVQQSGQVGKDAVKHARERLAGRVKRDGQRWAVAARERGRVK